MDDKNVQVVVSNGKLIYRFKLEDGSILECGHKELNSVIKKIDKGEIKIISFEN